MPEVGNLVVVVSADTAQAEAGLRSLSSSVSSAGSALQTALGGAAIAAVAGLGAAFVGSVNSAMDFEKQMSAVGAVAGASATEMEALTATALQLGKDTSFSAKEAAAGMEELVKAGVSVNDVIGGAGRASLDLAAAGAVSVADAAEIASNAMNVFGLKGADMAHVADQIAGAANASAIGVNDYKFSLSAAGAVAATVGIGFEDLTTAIAAMGNAGIKGSDAGTSLKTMLMNLSPTSKTAIAAFRELGIITEDGANQFFDATGKAKSFGEMAQVLQNALKGLTKEQQLVKLETMFGSDAIRAAAVLAQEGAAGFDELAASIGKVTAQAVAEERLNNLAGSLEKLKGSLETGAIMLGGLFTPILKQWVDELTVGVNRAVEIIGMLPDAWRTLQQAMTGQWEPSETLDPFINAVGNAGVAMQGLTPILQATAAFFTGTLVPALQATAGWFADHAELIAGLVAAFATFQIIMTVVGWITGLVAAWGALSTVVAATGGVVATIVAVLGGPLTLAILAVAAVIGVVTAAWIGNWGDIQGKTAAAVAYITPLIQNMLTAIEAFWTAHGAAILTILDAAWTIIVSQVTTAFTVLTGVVTLALQLLSGDWEGAWTTMTTVAQVIWDSWGVQLTAIWTIISTLFATQIAAIQSIWQAGWTAITAILTAAWNLLSTENQTRILALVALMTELWQTLPELWRVGTEAVVTLFTAWWATLSTTVTDETAKILAFLTAWWADIQALFQTTLDTLRGWWTQFWGTDLGAGISSALESLKKLAGDLGTAIMDALITGVNAKVQAMLDAVTGAVSGALSAARSLIGGAHGGSVSGNQAWAAIAREEGVDPALLMSLIEQESGGNQGARSGMGAIGLTQLMPSTAAGLGVDPYDELQNVRGGARYLKQMIDQFGSVDRALAAYNAGPGGGVPSVSAAYAQRVIGGVAKFRVPDGVGAAQRGMVPQLGQFSLQGGTLSAAEAAAFCGPAAAMWFANIYGRMPNKAEAEEMARQVGWTPEWGMTGPGSEQRLLAAMGVASNVDYSPTPAEIGALAGQNVPFMLSTAGHFYQVQGGNLGGLNVGASGTAAGGSPTMSLDQITALSGAINGIITLAPQMGAALAQSSAVGGAALQGLLVSATTLSDGSTVAITDMAGQITASIVDSSGQVVATYGAMATTVAAQTATMATSTLTSVTNLGTGLMTSTTDAAGNVITTVTDMSGAVTSQYATLANGVSLTMGDMSAGVLTSTTDLGTGIMTTVQDMSGNYVTTITDMSGNVTSQYVSLGADVTAATESMGADVVTATESMASETLSSVTDLGEGVLTITQDMAGNYVATITDMSGTVTSEYTSFVGDMTGSTEEMAGTVAETTATMGSDVAESVSSMVSDVENNFGDLSSAAEDATSALEGIGEIEIEAPDVGEIVDAMKDVQKAAEKAADAVDDVGDGDGGDDGDHDHRQSGGPVRAGHPYIVGEAGPELFVPGRGGQIYSHQALAGMGGGGSSGGGTETLVVDFRIDGQTAERIYVTGRELAALRGRDTAYTGTYSGRKP